MTIWLAAYLTGVFVPSVSVLLYWFWPHRETRLRERARR